MTPRNIPATPATAFIGANGLAWTLAGLGMGYPSLTSGTSCFWCPRKYFRVLFDGPTAPEFTG
jgi:hypothetical protein